MLLFSYSSYFRQVPVLVLWILYCKVLSPRSDLCNTFGRRKAGGGVNLRIFFYAKYQKVHRRCFRIAACTVNKNLHAEPLGTVYTVRNIKIFLFRVSSSRQLRKNALKVVTNEKGEAVGEVVTIIC